MITGGFCGQNAHPVPVLKYVMETDKKTARGRGKIAQSEFSFVKLEKNAACFLHLVAGMKTQKGDLQLVKVLDEIHDKVYGIEDTPRD